MKIFYECMHGTCQATVHLCLLLQDDGTGVSEDHSKTTSSSATAAVIQGDDTAVSSIYSGSSTDDDGSAPSTPPSFTQVGGAPHWGETSAVTDLSYIHPQTAKYLMKATVQSRLGQCCVHQDPQLMWGQQQFPVQQVSVSEAGSAGPSSRPSPSNSHSDSSVTIIPQGVVMNPSLDASALTQAQSANLSQQQQMAAILQQSQLHAMMMAVMQQTPPHLTSLLDYSVVGETSWPFPIRPAVEGDGGAVDPPTQGAVQGGHVLRLK